MRLERARRSIAAAVIDLRGASDVDATRDSIVLLRAHSPGIAIVVCTDGTPIDSVDLVVVGREQNHVDAVVRGIAQQIDEARLTRFDGDVRLAIDHVLSVPHRKLAPRARAAVLLRTLQLVGKDAADLLGVTVNTVQNYTTEGRDRLGWRSDVGAFFLLCELCSDVESVLADAFEDHALAKRVVAKLVAGGPAISAGRIHGSRR